MNSLNLHEKPVVLTLDDDIEINNLLQNWLQSVYCEAISFSNPKEFLQQFKALNPSLCIIDVNIGAPGIGFKIIEAVRHVLGKKPPIIIFSGESSTKEIAHGIDIGGDDYLIKPTSKSTLVAKVEHYLDGIRLQQRETKKEIPEVYRQIKILIDTEIEEISEFGIKVRSNELLSKGNVVILKSDFLTKFSTDDKNILGTVVSNWIHPEDRMCGAFVEFDPTNEAFLEKVRTWISNQTRNRGTG